MLGWTTMLSVTSPLESEHTCPYLSCQPIYTTIWPAHDEPRSTCRLTKSLHCALRAVDEAKLKVQLRASRSRSLVHRSPFQWFGLPGRSSLAILTLRSSRRRRLLARSARVSAATSVTASTRVSGTPLAKEPAHRSAANAKSTAPYAS